MVWPENKIPKLQHQGPAELAGHLAKDVHRQDV